ncbi:MAG TPA: succinate dehydrogenase assembly factor 2, partial [Woeseiaceae bacterium]|nr:succinate dehydrogenase assembly factor 2 [Woeseiaceae bacterium]
PDLPERSQPGVRHRRNQEDAGRAEVLSDPGGARLRWQCRRGMREMDELLVGWFDRCYANAADADKSAFRRLLELPDPLLIAYLLDGLEADDRELAGVIHRIRSGACTG